MVAKIEVVYYAICSQTGEIWETGDLKSLYHRVRSSFRCDLRDSKYYDCRGAILSYGIVVTEDDGSFHHESLRDDGYLFVSACDGKISSCRFERW